MVQYSDYRRLETELIALARARGFDGTPFLREPAPLGTREQEMQGVWLSLDVRPRPETIRLRKLVRDWARNIVLSSSNTPITATRPKLLSAKIARNRSRG